MDEIIRKNLNHLHSKPSRYASGLSILEDDEKYRKKYLGEWKNVNKNN